MTQKQQTFSQTTNKGLSVKQKSYIKRSHFTQLRRKLIHTKICKRIIFSAEKN